MTPGNEKDPYDSDPLDDADEADDADSAAQPGRAGFPEFVRKVAVAGMGALFMTEEGIRNLAGQLKLPKEVLGFILSQAEKTKDEVGRVLTEELRRFLQSEKLREEFVKLMSGMTLDVRAQIRLVPADEDKDEKAAPPEEGTGKPPRVVVSELNARRGKRTKKE